jgi:hypothetical protein
MAKSNWNNLWRNGNTMKAGISYQCQQHLGNQPAVSMTGSAGISICQQQSMKMLLKPSAAKCENGSWRRRRLSYVKENKY